MRLNSKIVNRIIKIILVIIIFICISFTNGNFRKVSVFEELFGEIILLPQKGISYIKNKFHEDNIDSREDELIEEKNKLEEENNILKEKLVLYELLEQENKDLKSKLEISNLYENKKIVVANVIAKTTNNWDEIYIIDKGYDDGINPKNTVLTIDGLVGYVLTCDNKTSKVVSILDATSSFSARASETREEVIIKGDISYKSNNRVKVTDIPLGVTYRSGDYFETSGIGGIYPKGITVGRVEEFIEKLNPVENEAVVKVSVDFKRLEMVAVIID